MLVIPVFISHQGCPHDCLFCNQQKISGAERKDVLPPGKITQIIEEWLGRNFHSSLKKDDVQVAFFGGSFTCLPQEQQQRMLKEVAPFLAAGQVHSLRCSTRPDCIDEEICKNLKKHGISTVELGVQSMDNRVLSATRRGHTVQTSTNAIRQLLRHGFTVGVQLMPGLPQESYGGFLRGVKQIVALAPHLLRLYPALVIENSAMAQLYAVGKYEPLSLDAAITLCAAANTLATKGGVEVIRMGLQASDSLEKSIIAGPYHPAFGELVRSKMWLQSILRKLRRLPPGKKALITVSHRDISAVVGRKRENKKRLDMLGFAGRYTIVAKRSVKKGCLHVVSQ